jgi:disulfide bond formation protein DsbB
MPKNYYEWIVRFQMIDTIIGIVGVCLILGAALIAQFFYHEAPCPLCELQRAALVNIGLALILNIKYGNCVSHWAMVIISALAGMAVSIRQILLHVNDPVGFGSAIVGLHMYTWCFIIFAVAIFASALMLLIYPENNQFKQSENGSGE